LAVRVPEAQRDLVGQERAREARVQDRATAEVRRTEVERRLAEARIEVERLEGDLNVAAERARHATERRARAHEERAQAESRAGQAEREREAAEAERRAAESARHSVRSELDVRTATEGETRGHLAARRDQVRELEASIQRHAEQLTALEVEHAAVERDVTELAELVQRSSERRAALERESRGAREQVEAVRAAVSRREREEHEATVDVERARHALAAAREHEAAVRLERRSAEEPVAQLAARRGALEKLDRERVGLAPAARALLEARDRFGDGAVLGPLSDFVRAPSAGAQLAERLLGDWLHAVLVRDADTVERVRAWHHEVQPGPVVLLPLAPGPRGGPAPAPVPGDISATGPAGPWLTGLLAGDEAIDGGALRRANGAVFLPGTGDTSGPLARRAELDLVLGELAHAEGRLAELEQKATAAAQAHAEAERLLGASEARAEHAKQEHREALATYDDALRATQRAERERTEAEEQMVRLLQRREERGGRRQQIATELDRLRAGREQLEADLGSQRASLAALEAAQEAARERRVHWQVEEAQVAAREQGAREREERAGAVLDAARSDIARLAAETAGLERDVEELERTRAQWTDTLGERRVAVQELEAAAQVADTAVHAAEQALATAEQALEERRAQLHELGEESHRLALEEAEAGAQRRVLRERLEAEWQKPAAELLAAAPEVEGDAAQLRDEAERLAKEIEAIGPVNALAVEEHAEELQRAQFLLAQRDDLVKARDALTQAVSEIDQTARMMFLESFNAIRGHFQTVFHTLFEGGECDVRLGNEADPLNSEIEIHAAPRGKRTQRIHLLSSGERALVAISLLFSIYLTKPAPFCVLDEVDAPLDDANVTRFVRLLDEFKAGTQFIVITHNPRTMQVADAVYGVTMQEPGVSSIVGVRLGESSLASIPSS
jgi:chromosome segregation protein